MAKTIEIEERTDAFIKSFNSLKDNGIIDNNEDVAKALGYKSGASISEILARRQNIPSAKWKNFKEKYRVPSDNSEEQSNNPNREYFTADQLFAMYMKAMERQDLLMEAQNGILKSIESKMAREDTQAKIVTAIGDLESNLNAIQKNQQGLQAQIQGSVRRDAERFVGDDPKKTKKELDMISKYAEQSLLASEKEGIQAGSGK